MTLKSLRSFTRTQHTSVHFVKPKTNDGTKYLFALCRVAGILAPDRFKILYAIYSLALNFVAIIIAPLMFVLSYTMQSEKLQLHVFLASLQVFFGVIACEIKFVAIICLRRYLFNIEAVLDKLDARIQNPEEVREVEKSVRFSKRTATIYTIVYYAFSTSTLMGAIYMERPPYSLYIPNLNWRESSSKLAICGALEYFLVNLVIIHQLINDTYAITYTGILQTHLKILIMRVLRIGTDPRCTQEDNLNELVRCLHDHKNIIELLNTIEPVISTTYFIQFLATTSCLVATLINMTTSTENYTLVGSVLYTLCLIMEILPICYIANCLAAESDRLPEAIFHMNWMDQNLQFQRMCLFFMHRSQETIVFFAGKMLAISLSTFVSIIKFTFSVYTVLGSLNFAEKFN